MNKGFFSSLTIRGVIITAVAWAFGKFAPQMGITSEDISKVVEVILGAIGIVVTVWGRVRAGGIKGLFGTEK